MPRLRRVDCSDPGIRRQRCGRGFRYLDENGAPVASREALDRIRELAIPPAWNEVWICSDPNGHLQATGVDAAGRKQYLYHLRWRERRDQKKYDQMIEFARSLPRMRRLVNADLRDGEMSRAQVLACAVRLLECGFFRIGSETYAEENESYGLATMRKEHVRLNGSTIVFDYPGKGGQRRIQEIVDADVRRIVSELMGRRGGGLELLAYRNGRRWHDIGSAEVNEYLKTATGGDFSAKDFRTWNATILAAIALARSGPPASTKTARKRVINQAVEGVAYYLGNTPAVARASYIDPRVFDRYVSGWTISPALAEAAARSRTGPLAARRGIGKAVLDLIKQAP